MQGKTKLIDICAPDDMACLSLVERLSAFVDGELSCEQEAILFKELAEAPHFIALLDETQLLRDTIREQCERKKMNPAVCDKLKSDITRFLNGHQA